MKNVLEILKRYWVEAACGLGAVLGILLIVLGLGTMGEVQDELNNALNVKNEIVNLSRGDAINQRAVDQSAKVIADVRGNFKKIMAYVSERNAYPPLVADIFPGDAGPNLAKVVEFRKAFGELRNGWLEKLKAGAEPTSADIAAERDRMEQQGKTQRESPQGNPGDPADPDGAPKATATLAAEQGAALRIAHSKYCYATPESFQESDVSEPQGPMESGPPPSPVQLWNAQLEVWVQQTVVDAIARVNEEAAKEIQASGGQPWVGNLPIKDLRSLQTSRYYIKEGLEVESSTGAQSKERVYPPTEPAATFTGRQSNEQYELMRFSVQLVVDAREIPRVLAGLSEHRFHVPVSVAFESIEPNLDFTGRIYGDAPVVLLIVDFETVLFSDLYLPLMPQDVLTALGKTRPEPPPSGA